MRDENEKWRFETLPFKLYFSDFELKVLAKVFQIKRKRITKEHQLFLTKIIVGNDIEKGEISPDNALKILQERSLILVENKLNERKFLKGICDKYTSSERGNIYMLIKNALENEWIETEGGGIGEIKKNLAFYVNSKRFKDIEKYKLFVLFDSDKKSPNDTLEDKNTQQKIIGFMKNIDKSENTNWEKPDKIVWYILHKRALENYAPLEQVFIKIYALNDADTPETMQQKEDLQNLQPSELDFLKYDKSNIGLKEEKIKEQFPEIFEMDFSYQLLEERCKHHKIQFETSNNYFIEISEIEQILLKIAKII